MAAPVFLTRSSPRALLRKNKRKRPLAGEAFQAIRAQGLSYEKTSVGGRLRAMPFKPFEPKGSPTKTKRRRPLAGDAFQTIRAQGLSYEK